MFHLFANFYIKGTSLCTSVVILISKRLPQPQARTLEPAPTLRQSQLVTDAGCRELPGPARKLTLRKASARARPKAALQDHLTPSEGLAPGGSQAPGRAPLHTSSIPLLLSVVPWIILFLFLSLKTIPCAPWSSPGLPLWRLVTALAMLYLMQIAHAPPLSRTQGRHWLLYKDFLCLQKVDVPSVFRLHSTILCLPLSGCS